VFVPAVLLTDILNVQVPKVQFPHFAQVIVLFPVGVVTVYENHENEGFTVIFGVLV
jgi:hypothetical protein